LLKTHTATKQKLNQGKEQVTKTTN
jgi:hypothetical protein